MDMLALSNYPQQQPLEVYGFIRGSNVGQPAPPPWLEDLSDEDQARIESVRQGEIERALIVEGTDFWLCEYQPTGLTGTNGKKWGYTARHYRQRRGTGWLIVGGLVLSLATTLWALSERSAYWQVQAKFDEKQNAFTTTQNNLVETKKNLENANNKIAENENKIKTLTAKIDEINSTSCNYNGIKNRILGVFNCFLSGNFNLYTVTKPHETINEVRKKFPSLTLKSIQRNNQPLQITQSSKIKRGDIVIFEKTPGSSNSCIQEVSTVTQELKSNPQ